MCEVFGRVFVVDEWEEVAGMNPEHARRLAENPTFEVEGERPAPEPEKGPAVPPSPSGLRRMERPGADR
jgi:hypothetical protein